MNCYLLTFRDTLIHPPRKKLGLSQGLEVLFLATLFFWIASFTNSDVLLASQNPCVMFDDVVADAKPVKDEKRVSQAVERAVAYIRKSQNGNGVFGNGIAFRKAWPIGCTALASLALLESGIPHEDPAMQRAALFVRNAVQNESRTYEISLAILFLDRLGKREDIPLMRSLGLRLAGGQSAGGAWSYQCPILTAPQEKQFLEKLRGRKPEECIKVFSLPKGRGAGEKADNSNTQFALLALWTMRKYEMPVEFTLGLSHLRFRGSQKPLGWGYNFRGNRTNGSMSCVGLLGLAIGRAVTTMDDPDRKDAKPIDPGIQMGLRTLGGYLNDPGDNVLRSLAGEWWGPEGTLNFYFLWSVERVGVLCGLKTIGGTDWYRWGVELILPAQQRDGSWVGRGSGASAIVDTSFALLFLKRSDLLPDLRETLQKRITIVDPGIDGKGVPPTKKSPGEKSGSPGEKGARLDALGDRPRELVPPRILQMDWNDHCSGRFWISSRNSAGV